MTSNNFTADNWIAETSKFVVTAHTILPANWSKIYTAAKEIYMKTQHPGMSTIIDLTVDEEVDKCIILVDVADSDDEDTPIAAPTVVIKKEAMNVHFDDVDMGDVSGSEGGGEDVEDEDDNDYDTSIDAYCKYCLFLHLIMLIISQNLLTPPASCLYHMLCSQDLLTPGLSCY